MEAQMQMTKERMELSAKLASMLVYDWSRGVGNLYRMYCDV